MDEEGTGYFCGVNRKHGTEKRSCGTVHFKNTARRETKIDSVCENIKWELTTKQIATIMVSCVPEDAGIGKRLYVKCGKQFLASPDSVSGRLNK